MSNPIDFKNETIIGKYTTSHNNTYSTNSTFTGLENDDEGFDIKKFSENLKINIIERSEESISFDLIGVDAPIANAIRRILISEVPTMAIELCVFADNTSVLPDEVIAHRLGLIPIKADPRIFKYPFDLKEKSKFDYMNETGTKFKREELIIPKKVDPKRQILFKLDVQCKKLENGKIINNEVFSKDLKWVPIGNQQNLFKKQPIKPVHDEILIAKLTPGQRISVECYCEKGWGKEHAKWQPVCPASYRLMPKITFKKPVVGKEAEELVKKCPLNVFDIEDLGDGIKKANVKNPRNCRMCRECVREGDWSEKIQLSRIKNHFIFYVESTGVLPPETLVVEALNIFFYKSWLKKKRFEKVNKKNMK